MPDGATTLASPGVRYTKEMARLELFPLGSFKDAYKGSSFKRHDKVKVMLAATLDYNKNAARERGQGGSYIDPSLNAKDLQTIFVDAHLKYKGLSWMTEYAQRSTNDDNPIVVSGDDVLPGDFMIATYYTGSALNTQLAYLLPSDWEIAARYTSVSPQEETGIADQVQYGLGLSRYIVGHNLKVQADFNLMQIPDTEDQMLFRLQTEFTF